VLFAIGIALGILLEWSVALGVYTGVRQFRAGACLPSDFPRYQGATTVSFNATSGTSSGCDVVFQSDDSASQVTDFYMDQLRHGNWQIRDASPADGTIAFERTSGAGVRGELRVLGRGVHSTFEVELQTGV
jgi:hypothetical protein